MRYLFIALLVFTFISDSYSQTDISKKNLITSQGNRLLQFDSCKLASAKFTNTDFSSGKFSLGYLRKDRAESTLPIAIGVWTFLYLLNPIVLFENDKIGLGITKEASIGFGYFGEHRASVEYSYIFRSDLRSNLRLGYKYDILLKKGIKPSNLLQGTPVIAPGIGYFTNFSRNGYFGETSFGYSVRNDKFLFYPSVKLRYTYVAKGSNIVDFSFGIIIGIANPFIDLKIRRDEK